MIAGIHGCKMLLPPDDRGSFIVGINGCLRIVDLPVCHGYANGCVCPACRARAAAPLETRIALQPWEQEAA